MNKTKSILLTASMVLAITFTLSCDVQAADQKDFYGVWVRNTNSVTNFTEINKDAMTITNIEGINVNIAKNRIVKWEKNNNNKSYVIYLLTEKNVKVSVPISIDAYSDLNLDFGGVVLEAKKSSQAELNKAIRSAEQAEADREKAKADAQSSFTDTRDKKTYKTVKIGSQTWMAQNLDYNANGSKCYGNQDANCNKYGRLYDWNTAKKSCPSGWHLPTEADWEILTKTVGGKSTEGKKLKAKSGWSNNGNGTDEYSFSAMPGGFDDAGDSFFGAGYYGDWWSASESEFGSGAAYHRLMSYNDESAYWYGDGKSRLFSVRCIKD